jgi:hypothetical protein
MRFSYHLAKVATLLAFFVVAVSPSWADRIPVRGGSSYGDNKGLALCQTEIANFASNPDPNVNPPDNCEGFAATTFTIGGNTYSGALFAFLEPNGTAFGTLDIIQLAANSSLTLNLLNPALPSGLFMCGSFGTDSNVAKDSVSAEMTGLPCTTGSSSNASGGYFDPMQEVPNVQANFLGNSVTFVNGTIDSIAIFATDGNIQGATATPEPATLLLIGIGALVVGRKLRRDS